MIQNRSRMQGRCVLKAICNTARLRDSNHLHAIPISQLHSSEAKSSVQTCGKLNIEQFFNPWFAATVKLVDFQGLYILPQLLAQSLLFSRQTRHKWFK